jgi:hypothetical protein
MSAIIALRIGLASLRSFLLMVDCAFAAKVRIRLLLEGRLEATGKPAHPARFSLRRPRGSTLASNMADVRYDKPGEFTAAENDARDQRQGLWADPNPTAPWEWRKDKRNGSRLP